LGSDFEGGRHFNRINKIPKTWKFHGK
jgi:hypothetical protein